jgi:hypothetical protein
MKFYGGDAEREMPAQRVLTCKAAAMFAVLCYVESGKIFQ